MAITNFYKIIIPSGDYRIFGLHSFKTITFPRVHFLQGSGTFLYYFTREIPVWYGDKWQ